MKIEMFQSSHGDCLLVESSDGRRILCDGGMPEAMIEFVSVELAARREAGELEGIDLVYVSHIDADHIGGILELLEDLVAWRAFDFHRDRGDEDFAEPDRPRPPEIGVIWHNAFEDQVDENVGRIEDMLAASAPVLLATQAPAGMQAGFEMSQIALGVEQALRVSKLAGANLLRIPINRLPGEEGPAKLLMARRDQNPIRLGAFEISIVGPTERELRKLREGWNNWLERSQERLERIEREVRRRIADFAEAADPQAIVAREWEGVEGFRNVTVPNLASLVLFVREEERTLLLTGDAQHDILLAQLEEAGLLQDGHLHLDVLKVQHHGSENNMSAHFARSVSADHYLFCGDGQSGNPEPRVLDQIFRSRMSDDEGIRARAPEASDDRPFHFWFSTSVDTPAHTAQARTNFRAMDAHARDLRSRSGGRLHLHFNSGAALTVEL